MVASGVLPGETVLTVRSSLALGQHVRVSWAGEHQLPHREVPQCPQTSAPVRVNEPLRPLYAFILHGSLYCDTRGALCYGLYRDQLQVFVAMLLLLRRIT